MEIKAFRLMCETVHCWQVVTVGCTKIVHNLLPQDFVIVNWIFRSNSEHGILPSDKGCARKSNGALWLNKQAGGAFVTFVCASVIAIDYTTVTTSAQVDSLLGDVDGQSAIRRSMPIDLLDRSNPTKKKRWDPRRRNGRARGVCRTWASRKCPFQGKNQAGTLHSAAPTKKTNLNVRLRARLVVLGTEKTRKRFFK